MSVILVGKTLHQEPSEEFRRRIRDFDKDLHISWNSRKERYVIEQCIQHSVTAPANAHDHLCRKVYVWMVQGDDGEPVPLGNYEWIIEKLKSFDTRKKYGEGPQARERYIREEEENNRIVEEAAAKAMRDRIEDSKKDNKRQLQQAMDLIDRHDVWRVNQ